MSVESGWKKKKTHDERLHARSEKSVRCMWAHIHNNPLPFVYEAQTNVAFHHSVRSLPAVLTLTFAACMSHGSAASTTSHSDITKLVAVLLTGARLACHLKWDTYSFKQTESHILTVTVNRSAGSAATPPAQPSRDQIDDVLLSKSLM